MGRMEEGIERTKPVVMMVLAQMSLGGVNILYKIAANDGMSISVLVAYRLIFATAFMLPLAFFVERNSRLKLTQMVLWEGFLAALFGGSMAQMLNAQGLVLTSATFASIMTNLNPAITFAIAVLLRMEKLELSTGAGIAKVVGTIISIGGALVLTFFKGAEIHISPINKHRGQHLGGHVASSEHNSPSHILGSFLALASTISISLGLIFQAKVSQRYPCQYSSSALILSMAAVQASVFAFLMENDWTQWKLGWNVRLLTVAYGGIFASGIMLTFIMLCLRTRGPLFVSIFSPLMLVTVAIASPLLLNENLYLGSMIGAVIIIVGLYLVLWGKGKEMTKTTQNLMPSKISKDSDGLHVPINPSPETRITRRNSGANGLGQLEQFQRDEEAGTSKH